MLLTYLLHCRVGRVLWTTQLLVSVLPGIIRACIITHGLFRTTLQVTLDLWKGDALEFTNPLEVALCEQVAVLRFVGENLLRCPAIVQLALGVAQRSVHTRRRAKPAPGVVWPACPLRIARGQMIAQPTATMNVVQTGAGGGQASVIALVVGV